MGRAGWSLCIRGAIWLPRQLISSGHELFESFLAEDEATRLFAHGIAPASREPVS